MSRVQCVRYENGCTWVCNSLSGHHDVAFTEKDLTTGSLLERGWGIATSGLVCQQHVDKTTLILLPKHHTTESKTFNKVPVIAWGKAKELPGFQILCRHCGATTQGKLYERTFLNPMTLEMADGVSCSICGRPLGLAAELPARRVMVFASSEIQDRHHTEPSKVESLDPNHVTPKRRFGGFER